MIEFLKPVFSKALMPIARICIAADIHPNAITGFGAALSVVSAVFIAQGKWLWAAVCIGVTACMDGMDGLVAGLTGKKSLFGAILDSCCDRITEILWFFGIYIFYCIHPIPDSPGFLESSLAFAAMSGSIMISYVRARCEGVNVPIKEGFMQRPERIIAIIVCLLSGRTIMSWGLAAISILTYATVMQRLFIAHKLCKKREGTYDMQRNS
jgi:CDP-diacylglycerol---glycerol-3-phosphate 3-phosphatidyltransferase